MHFELRGENADLYNETIKQYPIHIFQFQNKKPAICLSTTQQIYFLESLVFISRV